MEKWLVVSNCNTFGLANSLTLLNPAIEVDAVDIWTFKNNLAKYRQPGVLSPYTRVLLHPEAEVLDGNIFLAAKKTHRVPSINFAAYHPDITYAKAQGEFSKGPMGDYHSLIVIAAHKLGYSAEKAVSFFNGETYKRAGYYDLWRQERDAAIAAYSKFGLDISGPIRKWGQEDAFMYSVNHPKIRVLFDIAKVFLESLSIKTVSPGIFPQDNLANGPWWPVYPEIGEHYGVGGSYLFKIPQQYHLMPLQEFVKRSLELYSSYPAGAIQAMNPRYEQVKAAINV